MKNFFRYYSKYYKDYKKQFFFAFIGMIMVSVSSSATAYLIKPILDKIFIAHNDIKLIGHKLLDKALENGGKDNITLEILAYEISK